MKIWVISADRIFILDIIILSILPLTIFGYGI